LTASTRYADVKRESDTVLQSQCCVTTQEA